MGWQNCSSQNVYAPSYLVCFLYFVNAISSSTIKDPPGNTQQLYLATQTPQDKKEQLNDPNSDEKYGSPNIHLYYRAVILEQLKLWWNPSTQSIWKQIEVVLVKDRKILLGTSLLASTLLTGHNNSHL